jgi:hypothetical protein
MAPYVEPGTTGNRLELSIKRFLTEFDLLDQQLRTSKDIPKVISSFNYVSLLNLPETAERFGPLRNLWEGSYKGEGYIQHCKQYLRNGQRKGFAANTMKRSLLGSAFMREQEKIGGKDASRCETVSDFIAKESSGYITYGRKTDAEDIISGRKILSVICMIRKEDNFESGEITCFFLTSSRHLYGLFDREVAVYGIGVSGTHEKTVRVGCVYSDWSQMDGPWNLTWLSESFPMKKFEVSFGILLPLMDGAGPPRHTLVSKSRIASV